MSLGSPKIILTLLVMHLFQENDEQNTPEYESQNQLEMDQLISQEKPNMSEQDLFDDIVTAINEVNIDPKVSIKSEICLKKQHGELSMIQEMTEESFTTMNSKNLVPNLERNIDTKERIQKHPPQNQKAKPPQNFTFQLKKPKYEQSSGGEKFQLKKNEISIV